MNRMWYRKSFEEDLEIRKMGLGKIGMGEEWLFLDEIECFGEKEGLVKVFSRIEFGEGGFESLINWKVRVLFVKEDYCNVGGD